MLDHDPAPKTDSQLYECLDCGARHEDPETRLCGCGGYLSNISNARPL